MLLHSQLNLRALLVVVVMVMPTTRNPLPLNVNQGGTHPENQNCALVFCHGDVVSIDSTTTQIYTFIDKNKHINGKLSFGGTEYTY